MKALDALRILAGLMASQRGFVTTAQAERAGVSRQALARLEGSGHIERVMPAVYRSCAAPSTREERVYAAWLILDRTKYAWERTRDENDAVASHATAAWLMGLGELNPEPLTFTSVERKQVRRCGIRTVKSRLQAQDVILVNNIPTTSPERTVLDLLRDGEDESLVANVLRDFASGGTTPISQAFRRRVDGMATRYGHPAGYPLFDAMIMEGARA